MSKLSEAEIVEKLPAAKGWERHGDMLVRTWQFPSFRRSIEFVNHVAALS
ncbi:MAG: 4a-hydroxytetrahydrobiopterin dehydratase, partial [Isosphaeraceae bacterium]